MTTGDGTTNVEVASWAREGATIHPPTFSFQDTDAGRRARRDAIELLARGEEAVVRDGAQIQLSAPKAFHELAPTEGTAQANRVTLSPGEPIPVAMEIKSPLDDLAFQFDLRPIPPQPGAVVAFAGYAGSALVEVNISLLEEPNVRAGISMHGSFGEDAATNRETTHTLLVFNAQTEVSLDTEVLFPASGGLSGQFAGDGLGEDMIDSLRARLVLYESVVWLEEQIGQKIRVPSTLTADEIAEVEEAVHVLKTGEGRTTFRRLEGDIENPAEIPDLPQRFAEEGPVREPMTAQIFGQSVHLGIGEFDLPKLRVVDITPRGPVPDSPAHVVLEADGDPRIDFRLVDASSDSAGSP